MRHCYGNRFRVVTLKTTGVLHLGMLKGLIMISIYKVIDVACI